jgi:hypothetical protein
MGASLSRAVFLAAGTLYPGYGTFKALESRNVADVKQWLAYWIVRAAMQGAEYGVGGAVRGLVPFYGLLKLGFIAWLAHPRHRGALYCYGAFVRPYLVKHQNGIDGGLARAERVVAARTRAVSERAVEWLERKKQETVEFVTQELKKAAVETIAGRSAAAAALQQQQQQQQQDESARSGGGGNVKERREGSATEQSGGNGPTPVSVSP